MTETCRRSSDSATRLAPRHSSPNRLAGFTPGTALPHTLVMDQTPSLRRALIGLAALIAIIAGGYLWLQSASDDAGPGKAPGSQIAVVFIRSGGFTGKSNTLILRDDATGSLSGDAFKKPQVPVRIGEGRLRDLLAELDSIWPDTSGPVNSPEGCADCYQYDVTFKGVRVTIHGVVPDRFTKPIETLENIMDRKSRN